MYVITVTHIDGILDYEDKEVAGVYIIDASTEDEALDCFHNNIPINVLDYFDIEAVPSTFYIKTT